MFKSEDSLCTEIKMKLNDGMYKTLEKTRLELSCTLPSSWTVRVCPLGIITWSSLTFLRFLRKIWRMDSDMLRCPWIKWLCDLTIDSRPSLILLTFLSSGFVTWPSMKPNFLWETKGNFMELFQLNQFSLPVNLVDAIMVGWDMTAKSWNFGEKTQDKWHYLISIFIILNL